jgi:hypothetical protein
MAMGVVRQVRMGVPHPAMPVEMGVGLAGRIGDAVLVTMMLIVQVKVSPRTIQSIDRSRSATRRAISADASSGIGNTELTLISQST